MYNVKDSNVLILGNWTVWSSHIYKNIANVFMNCNSDTDVCVMALDIVSSLWVTDTDFSG